MPKKHKSDRGRSRSSDTSSESSSDSRCSRSPTRRHRDKSSRKKSSRRRRDHSQRRQKGESSSRRDTREERTPPPTHDSQNAPPPVQNPPMWVPPTQMPFWAIDPNAQLIAQQIARHNQEQAQLAALGMQPPPPPPQAQGWGTTMGQFPTMRETDAQRQAREARELQASRERQPPFQAQQAPKVQTQERGGSSRQSSSQTYTAPQVREDEWGSTSRRSVSQTQPTRTGEWGTGPLAQEMERARRTAEEEAQWRNDQWSQPTPAPNTVTIPDKYGYPQQWPDYNLTRRPVQRQQPPVPIQKQRQPPAAQGSQQQVAPPQQQVAPQQRVAPQQQQGDPAMDPEFYQPFDEPPLRCSFCGREGHEREECRNAQIARERRETKAQGGPWCSRCQEAHGPEDCPKQGKWCKNCRTTTHATSECNTQKGRSLRARQAERRAAREAAQGGEEQQQNVSRITTSFSSSMALKRKTPEPNEEAHRASTGFMNKSLPPFNRENIQQSLQQQMAIWEANNRRRVIPHGMAPEAQQAIRDFMLSMAEQMAGSSHHTAHDVAHQPAMREMRANFEAQQAQEMQRLHIAPPLRTSSPIGWQPAGQQPHPLQQMQQPPLQQMQQPPLQQMQQQSPQPAQEQHAETAEQNPAQQSTTNPNQFAFGGETAAGLANDPNRDDTLDMDEEETANNDEKESDEDEEEYEEPSKLVIHEERQSEGDFRTTAPGQRSQANKQHAAKQANKAYKEWVEKPKDWTNPKFEAKVAPKGPKTREEPRNFYLIHLKDHITTPKEPLPYYICKRNAKLAIGIFMKRREALLGLHPDVPMFMQFGYNQMPDAAYANDLVPGDSLLVEQYARLAHGSTEVPQEFQQANADPKQFLDPETKTVNAACVALKFQLDKFHRGPHIDEVGIIDSAKTIGDNMKTKFRIQGTLVSKSFTDSVQFKNTQLAYKDQTPLGFTKVPAMGTIVMAHITEAQKGQTRFIGDLRVPIAYKECAPTCLVTHRQLLWIEEANPALIDQIKQNAGLGNGYHTTITYAAHFRAIKDYTVAIAAGERQKLKHTLQRAKVSGTIKRFLDDHNLVFELDNKDYAPKDIDAQNTCIQPFARGKLTAKDRNGRDYNICNVLIESRKLKEGEIRKLTLKRTIVKYTMPKLDGNPPKSAKNAEAEEEGTSQETETSSKTDWDLPGLNDKAYFKHKHFPTTGIQLKMVEDNTGLESRVELLKQWTKPFGLKELAGANENMREELIPTFIPLKKTRDPPDFYTEHVGKLPRDRKQCPRFHTWKDSEVHLWAKQVGNEPLSEEDMAKLRSTLQPEATFTHQYNATTLNDFLVEIEADESLNEEQKLFVHIMMYHFQPVCNLQAPAGSGKTSTLARLIYYMAKYRPKDRIVAVAPTNRAAMGLARKAFEALGFEKDEAKPEPKMLVLQSHMASNMEIFTGKKSEEEESILNRCDLEAHIMQLIEERKNETLSKELFSDSKLEMAKTYLEIKEKYPGCVTFDSQMAEEVIKTQANIQLIVTTLDKAMQLCKTFGKVDMIIIDEAGQARTIDAHMLAIHTSVKQMAFAGDVKQLPPYEIRNFKFINHFRYITHSISEFFTHWMGRSRTLTLTKVYRFHPAMVPIIGQAFYDNSIASAIDPDQRKMAENSHVHMASKYVPVTLIHSTNPPERGSGHSLRNREQEAVAVAILTMLVKFAPYASKTVVCNYTATATAIEEKMEREMEKANVPDEIRRTIRYHTVHAYIGQEADFVIDVTTRAKKGRGEYDFVLEARTTCVALTRAKQAFWLIGNLDYLTEVYRMPNTGINVTQGTEMGKFIAHTLCVAPPLDAGEITDHMVRAAIKMRDPVYHQESGMLLSKEGKPMVADCEVARKFGWNANSTTHSPNELQIAALFEQIALGQPDQ